MTDAVTSDALPEGAVVAERYRVERLLGQGAMGAVYAATHVHMRKRVALKVLLPDVSNSAEVLERFEREAMAAAHIEHPNVVAATDFGRTNDGAFFLVLEYVEGESLRVVVHRGALAPRRAARIAQQIASALGRAHALGIVHRDLKPDNVMLVPREGGDELVKVLDFGIAKVPVAQLAADKSNTARSVLTQIGSVFGTPEYMAPEQAMGETVDSRADLYALGICLYEMLAGTRPFEADSAVVLLTMHVTAPPPPIAVRAPGTAVPPELEALVMKLLAKKPEDRPASAQEVEAMLAEFLASAPSSQRMEAAPISSPGTWTKNDAIAKTHLPDRADAAGGPSAFENTLARLTPLAAKVRSSLATIAERMPPPARPFVPIAALALPLVFVLVIVVAAWPRSSKHAKVESQDAGVVEAPAKTSWSLFAPKLADERLAAAADAGVPALAALAKEFPDDIRVPREIVRAHSAQGDHAQAMDALAKLLQKDPKAVSDPAVGAAVEAALEADPVSFDIAMSLLPTPLGSRIVDALLEGTKGPNKARFQKALARADVRAQASPTAAIVFDLRDAKSCEARRALLPRAKDGGDARALAIIETYKRTRGCGVFGAFDCYGCMRRDTQLDDTVTALEARVGKSSSNK